ncbi:glycosyltransferase [Bremerella sp. P1]|uniref:glycosyltransferase n=1 Tax=Bremerella sp. P1 TaxID=3026424 RepID=UPI002367C322|nr:glycosyltransferase [Bremerella sp. P1]WDI41259.1 glycosyltransferase [Bremerella sp. P1]
MSIGKLPIARRVLITNFVLDHGTGTEAYVRDLARRLVELDRHPVVYTPRVGRFAQGLIHDGIPVIDDLSKLSVTPDIIHGHHSLETAAAATRFPSVPVISFCHDAEAWHDTPLNLPNVVHYVGVDQACYDRLVIQGGISPEKVSLIPNGVNLDKFPVRTDFAEAPRSVLCFCNGFSDHHLDIVRSASPGLHVEGLGLGSNRFSADPGSILPQFDIILARGRCAREAIASGAATIAAGVDGIASMVTPDNYSFLQRNNFGRRVLTKAFTVENIRKEIDRYDAAATREVTLQHRNQTCLANTVQQLTDLYDREKSKFSENSPPVLESSISVSQLLAWASLHANVVKSVAPPEQTPATLPAKQQSSEEGNSPTVPTAKPKRSAPARIARECKRVVRRTLRAVSSP